MQGETAPPPTSAPPTLQPILKSPSSLPRGRQKRLREHPLPLHRGEPGAANVQAGHTRAGSSARGCAHRPLRRGTDHARTVRPTPPPRAREGSREGGGAGARRKRRWGRAWRVAPGDHDPWLARPPGWPQPPGGHDSQATLATGHCRDDLHSAQRAGSQRLSRSGTSVSR